MNKILRFAAPVFVLMSPALALAQTDPFATLIARAKTWVGAIIPIVIGIALIFFIWNMITLIRTEDETAREEAKKGMVWAVIAMFVAISIYGIILFIRSSLGVGGDTSLPPPTVP